MKTFLRKRLPAVLLPFFIINMLYVMAFTVIGQGIYDPWLWIQQIFGKDLINVNGWYIVTLFWFYLAYWAAFRWLPSKAAWMGMFVFNLAYIGICYAVHMGVWWYNTAPCFMLGMIWAQYEKQSHAWMKRGWWGWMTASTGLTCAGVLIYRWCYDVSAIWTFIGSAVSALAFVVLVVALSMKVKLNNPAANFLGRYSFEIYLIHHLLFSVVRLPVFHIQGNMAFTLSVIGLACVMAVILKPLDDSAVKVVQKLISGGKVKEKTGESFTNR